MHRYWKAKHVEHLQHQAREKEVVVTGAICNGAAIESPDGVLPACAIAGAETEASLPARDGLLAGYIQDDATVAMSRVTGAHSDENELAMVREWCAGFAIVKLWV